MPGDKKNLNLMILQVLKKYSDETHHLCQNKVIDYLDRDYDITCDRRSVHNNIFYLQEMEHDLGVEIGDDNGLYLAKRLFSEAELRLLTDSVFFSRSLTGAQADELIEKIKQLGSEHFRKKIPHVHNFSGLAHSANPQLFDTLSKISDAIHGRKKITFHYNDYGTDKKLHTKGITYLVSPYQLVTNNGHYYLICNYDKYDNISHYRLDRITEVSITDLPVKPVKNLPGYQHGLNLAQYMAEHIYMFSNNSERVTIRTTPDMMNDLIDWFGDKFSVIKTNDPQTIEVSLRCNQDAIFYWALQYGLSVEVIKPASLRSRIREAIRKMSQKYDHE